MLVLKERLLSSENFSLYSLSDFDSVNKLAASFFEQIDIEALESRPIEREASLAFGHLYGLFKNASFDDIWKGKIPLEVF